MSRNPQVEALEAAGNHLRLRVRGGPSPRSLADLLAAAGYPLNTRCGQRGLCRGCIVGLVEGTLLAPGNETVGSGQVKSCQMRLTGEAPVILEIARQQRLSDTPLVGESFVVDVPYDLDPSVPFAAPRDTAFAIDLGTTTVVLMLVDLTTGAILSRAGDFNAQIRFGDNVITRIGAAADPAKRREMRRTLVAETFGPLLDKAMRDAGRDATRLAGGVIAGNTTMLHILADEDTRPLGVAPFAARFLDSREYRAADLGFRDAGMDENLPVRLLPGFAAYVGADIVAGVHATGMTLDAKPGLLVDMGTNGEIVLFARGRLVACATAAGPAFEGSGLTGGTRAQRGAISRIRITPQRTKVETIGGKTPADDITGICGSAYIDFLSDARRLGWLRENGRFEREAWHEIPDKNRGECEDGLCFLPCGPRGPRITEADIAMLLQAKAAIAAGIDMLLRSAGVEARAIGRVHLAGGFGMYVDVSHAIAIGLLPGFHSDQVSVVGNTSLAGAWLAAIDRQALVEMETLRQRAQVIELNELPDFEAAYIDHLALP